MFEPQVWMPRMRYRGQKRSRPVASGTIPDKPEQKDAAVNAALDKMFASYPPGAAK